MTRLHGPVGWASGNQTNQIEGGKVPGVATVYSDDAVVSTEPAHELAKMALAAKAVKER